MLVIGLTGYARAGKDTVADWMVREYGFRKLSFADPLKELALRLNPEVMTSTGRTYSLRYAVEEFGWDITKEKTDARDYLVELGAGARELIGSDVWMVALRRRMLESPDEKYVISDVRYRNEVWMIQNEGGEVWEIRRPGCEPANPEEEASFMEVWPDAVLHNDGTREDVLKGAVRLLDRAYRARGGTGIL